MDKKKVILECSQVVKEVEEKCNAFKLKSEGIRVWERMRYKVFRKIIEKKLNQEKGYKENVKNYKRIITESIRNIFFGGPLFWSEKEILTLGHQRRKKMKDELFWDIYFDPIYKVIDKNYTHMEYPNMFTHKRPAKTKNIKYLDIIENISKIYKKFGRRSVSLKKGTVERLNIIRNKIELKTDIKLKLKNMLKKVLAERKIKVPFFKRVIRKVKPNLVLLVTSYENESLVEACKDTNTKVAELQHGVIHDSHLGYSYDGKKNKQNFPDYFLAFGKYWRDTTSLPINSKNIFCVGYPYLEKNKICKKRKRSSKENIVFISQSIIGHELSKFAVEMSNYYGTRKKIYYKLHPKEYKNWESKYPWLLESKISVVDEKGPELYELFEISSIQVAVYSTAIYEGIYFGLDTFIYKTSGYKTVEDLEEKGLAKIITNPRDLEGYKSKSQSKNKINYLFEDNSKDKMKKVIEHIIQM